MSPNALSEEGALTKAELTDRVHEATGVTRAEAQRLVESVFETIKTSLAADDEGTVKISGFGTFQTREKAPRIGQNPRTLERLLIDRRKVVVFKISQVLRAELNEEPAE